MKPTKVLLMVVIVFALSDTGWASLCGDTAGPGGTKVPCSCGDTVVTNTTLLSPAANPVNGDPVVSIADSDVCPLDGLIVNTAKINLSLGGNVIRGSGVGVGIKIIGVGLKATIRNGFVRGFGTGLATDAGSSSNGSSILKITFSQGGTGIMLAGDGNEFNGNDVLSNNGAGIQVLGQNNLLLSNRVSHNGGDGIGVNGDGTVLRKSSLNRNGGRGIHVTGNNAALISNLVENSGQDGIVVEGGGDGNPGTADITNNKALTSGGRGLTVQGNNYVITENQADFNNSDGLTVIGTGNRLGKNKARDNKGNGLVATGINPSDDNIDDGGNLGKRNLGIQCQIDGQACRL